MNLETFSYSPQAGWSVPQMPSLDSDQTVVMVFGASQYLDSPGAIQELVGAYPTSHVIGCSTSGEIFDTVLSDGSLAVAVAAFHGTSIQTAAAPVHSAAESYAAGTAIAQTLDKPDLQAVFVLSDGLNVNGSQLVRGLNTTLPESVIVTGGLAGDGDRFKSTWVIHGGKLHSSLVTAVGFYGSKVKVGHGSKGGWDIFGPERRVTRSAGNVLFELDGKPALELYKQYLGERASGLPATALLFPLALRADDSDQKQIVRTILAVNEADQSMTFAGDIPQGYLAQLMKANFDRLIDGASQAASTATGDHQNASGQALSIAISCVGRRLILGERAEDEIESVMDVLPHGTRQIGFYSYGEISPYTTGHCDLHNQTMTLTTISEG